MASKNLIGYGELLLRLTPYDHGSLIEQCDKLKMGFAGAEANIIADLAVLGHETEFITALPDNPLGRSGLRFLNQFGIHTKKTIWDNSRMGTYYIEHGSSIRSTNVTYDRAGSAVSLTDISNEYWNEVFRNCNYFILSGITPALSLICQNNISRALPIAKDHGVKIAFDLNYRRNLWDSADALKSMESILPFVDILFANTGSAADLFDIKSSETEDYELLESATQHAADALDELGDFDTIGMTMRLQKSASENILGGLIKKDGAHYLSKAIPTTIIDRLGGGDAFVAGVIHGEIKEWSVDQTVNFATAAFAATQTLNGDINYLTEKELLAMASGNIQGYVKR